MLKKFSFLIFFICFNSILNAQYTELINSNYPGFSQSPYSVGTGVYQIESNFFNRNSRPSPMFDNTSAYGVNLHFRTTFLLENLELNALSSLQKDITIFKNVFESSTKQSGLGQLTLGAKYLVFKPKYKDNTKIIRSWRKRHGFDWNRWIPHVGVYAGANIGTVLNTYHKKGGISPKVGILLQHEFDLRYNFITNIYYDYIGTNYSEWSYILTATYLLSTHWSGFIEHEAKYTKYENTGNIGGGLAYLFNKNLQVNASVRSTFQENSPGYYASVGASYRLDFHKDKFTEVDEFGNPVGEKEGEGEEKEESFFKKLWTNIKGLVVKQEKVEIETINEDGEVETKIVKVDIDNRGDRKKSVLGNILNSDKRSKDSRKKANKKVSNKERSKARKEEKENRKKAKVERKAKEKEKLKKIDELQEILDELKKQREEFEEDDDESEENGDEESEEDEDEPKIEIEPTEEEKEMRNELNKLQKEVVEIRLVETTKKKEYLQKDLFAKIQKDYDKKEYKILLKEEKFEKKIAKLKKKARKINDEKKELKKLDPDFSMEKNKKELKIDKKIEKLQEEIKKNRSKTKELDADFEIKKEVILDKLAKADEKERLKKEKAQEKKQRKENKKKEAKDKDL